MLIFLLRPRGTFEMKKKRIIYSKMVRHAYRMPDQIYSNNRGKPDLQKQMSINVLTEIRLIIDATNEVYPSNKREPSTTA